MSGFNRGGLVENVLKLFEFSIHYDKKSLIYDRKGQYPLEFSLAQFRHGGVSYQEGNLICIYEGPLDRYKHPRRKHSWQKT